VFIVDAEHPGRALIDLPLEIDAATSRPAEHCRAAQSGKVLVREANEAVVGVIPVKLEEAAITHVAFGGVGGVAVEMSERVGEAKRVLLVCERHAARAVDHPSRGEGVADLGVHRADRIDGGIEVTNGGGLDRQTTLIGKSNRGVLVPKEVCFGNPPVVVRRGEGGVAEGGLNADSQPAPLLPRAKNPATPPAALIVAREGDTGVINKGCIVYEVKEFPAAGAVSLIEISRSEGS